MKKKLEYETPEIKTFEINLQRGVICGSAVAPGGSEDIGYEEW